MTQTELDRQVSRFTGESLREVRRRGFSILTPAVTAFDPEGDELHQPQTVDWERVEADRYARAA